jgi:hypothetical protein
MKFTNRGFLLDCFLQQPVKSFYFDFLLYTVDQLSAVLHSVKSNLSTVFFTANSLISTKDLLTCHCLYCVHTCLRLCLYVSLSLSLCVLPSVSILLHISPAVSLYLSPPPECISFGHSPGCISRYISVFSVLSLYLSPSSPPALYSSL